VPVSTHQSQATGSRGGALPPGARLTDRATAVAAGPRLGATASACPRTAARPAAFGGDFCLTISPPDRSSLLADLDPRLGVRTEFQPSPQETCGWWVALPPAAQPAACGFGNMPSEPRLIGVLQQRPDGASTCRRPAHSPASAGLRRTCGPGDDRQRGRSTAGDQLLDWWGQAYPTATSFQGTWVLLLGGTDRLMLLVPGLARPGAFVITPAGHRGRSVFSVLVSPLTSSRGLGPEDCGA